MKRLLGQSALVVVLSLLALTSILVGFIPRASQALAASTSVCGPIDVNTTWTVFSSPYQICNNLGGVIVGPTATLTIQPGVTVQFQSGPNAQLNIQGALTAIGTATQPITFTGVVTTPAWGDISANGVITPALVNLSYVTLEYGGGNSDHAQLYVDHGSVTMTHSLVRHGSNDGLYFTHLVSGFNIQTTNFISNGTHAIELVTPATDIQLSNLSASGNGTNAVYLFAQGWNVTGQRHWTNPGIPYVIDYSPANHPGDELTIDPGSELQFTSTYGLFIGGQLKAIGLPDQPITFTSQTHTPGGWLGLDVDGGATNAVAQLDHAAIEYGGGGSSAANVTVNHGQIIAHHTTVRYSAKDGVRFVVSAGGSILNSQIVSNSQTITTAYGVYVTDPTRAVLATNNWWGDPNGPTTSATPNCSTGQGSKVTSGVLFRPVLTDTNLSAEFPLSDAPQLTLTPRRWFAPAEGVSKIYFDIVLRDGNGAPLAGRTVHLNSSLGTVSADGLTDLTGHTLVYLMSNSVGDANVSVALTGLGNCESAMSPSAKVTFTAPILVTDLFPNSPAPYFDNNISLTPLPVVTGISETIHAKLVNPLTVPITVDVTFGFAQSSIGLAFGPIKTISSQLIPPTSTVDLSADFMPLVSGHYCVQITYAITAIGSAHLLRPQAGSQLKQFNINAQQGGTIPPDGKDTLDKADKSWKKVEKLSPRGTNIQMGLLDEWWDWAKDSAKKISQALGFDPPRQDYTVSTLPVWHRWPVAQPIAGSISITRANALNAASTALADVVAYGSAAATALDRYGGASEAGDLTWAAQQANAQLYYQQQMGTALLAYADKLDAFVQVLQDEHAANLDVTVGDVISYQQSIAITFTQQELANAKLVGLSDADIEAYRQEIIAADPNDLAGNILDMYSNEAFVSRNLGNALLHPHAFAPGFSVGGSAGLRPTVALTATGNTLAQINNIATTVPLSNSLPTTATISVLARRIDLPADWAVDVSPAQVTLAPNQLTTVTVSILTGSPAPQGSVPRVAVEGYANSQLLGGVVVDVIVPNYMPYFLHVYLPLIRK
jgi:hypothetical protein